MKKASFLLGVMMIAAVTTASAQRQKSIKTIRIKTAVECQVCQKILENYLRREDGIEYVNVNYHNDITTVKYYSERTNPENIKIAINNAGFDADDEKAVPDAKRRLPPCCKNASNPVDSTKQKKQQ